MTIQISDYHPSQYKAIADIFHAAVHTIDNKIYSETQQEAWAPTPPDYDFWRKKLATSRPFVALHNDRVIAFAELENDGYIDCFYVAPEYQGQGVASRLYQHLENSARERGMTKLFVEASLLIKPLFLNRGFDIQKKNRVRRNGETLCNFSMIKYLG